MNHFVVYTDSGCDIAPELLKEWGVYSSSLTFRFDGDEKEYSNDDMTVRDFYSRMRAGGAAKTAAINVGTCLDAFEKLLKQGLDILYLGFSSRLSATCSSAEIAAQQLRGQYPERTVITIDTLAASAGHGMLVYLAQEKKLAGASLQETADYIEKLKLRIAHHVTVEDLVYLKRGGRISSTAAVVGNVLGIKQIIHVDNEGGLVSISKGRGRKNSIAVLADKFAELAVDLEPLEYLNKGGRISHTAYRVGNVANVKPILHIRKEGLCEIPSKALGNEKTGRPCRVSACTGV